MTSPVVQSCEDIGLCRLSRARRSTPTPTSFLGKHADQLAILAIPLIFFAAVSAYWLPIVLNRYDDGRRDAAVIQTPEATLQWAPAGPGWNWRQDFGGYPSWSGLALYGVEPVGLDDKASTDATMDDMATTGLCGYLSEDGTELAQEWIGSWRMPTTSEVVSCLVSDGETAGCRYDPATRHSDCDTRSDKETPLWAPDQPPIYMWTLDQATSPGEADYVGYNGTVRSQPIDFANPRHGYRCVRTLQSADG